MPDEATLAHELSHMWFGDSVTLTQWPDIWLHEGFATWSEWIWSEYSGNKSAQQYFDDLYNTPPQDIRFWTPPPGDPGTPAFLFNGTIYYRGGMTLQALREKVGDFAFFQIMLRTWVAQNRYGNVTTPQFIALAEQISGMDLDHFFDVWLYQPEKPTYLVATRPLRAVRRRGGPRAGPPRRRARRRAGSGRSARAPRARSA